MKTKIIISALFLLAAGFAGAFSTGKQEVFDKLADKYGSISSVSLKFELLGQDLKGSLTAQKGNKYKLKIGDRLIICDGETIWNYTESDGKVIVSSYEEAAEGEFSIENFFFDLISGYQPSSLNKTNSSAHGMLYKLKLEPKSEAAEISSFSLDSAELLLDPDSFSIKKVIANNGGEIQEWNIYNIKTDKKYAGSFFKFDIPENTNLIDLR